MSKFRALQACQSCHETSEVAATARGTTTEVVACPYCGKPNPASIQGHVRAVQLTQAQRHYLARLAKKRET